MSCPNAAYLALVRTRSGLTPETPWRGQLKGVVDLPTSAEYEEWRALAYEITDAVWLHYVKLGDVETALQQQDPELGFPMWNQLRPEINRIFDERKGLPAVTDSWLDLSPEAFTWIAETDAAIRVSSDAACVLQQVDEALIGYGLKPPVGSISPKAPAAQPDRPSMGILGTIGVLAVTGAAVGGVVWYGRRE